MAITADAESDDWIRRSDSSQADGVCVGGDQREVNENVKKEQVSAGPSLRCLYTGTFGDILCLPTAVH